MTEITLDQLFNMAEALRGANLQVRTVESIQEQLRAFLENYRFQVIGRSQDQIWHRARRCEDKKPFSNLSEMIYPPQESHNFSRAQIPGSSVLYASWNEPTALEEIGAQVGDWIQLILLRPILGVDVPCHVIGAYRSFFASGRSVPGTEPLEGPMDFMKKSATDDFVCSVFVDSVITEFFKRRVKWPSEYKLTAVYAEILHKINGGLMYPSVENDGNLNLAIPAAVFDEKFEVIGTELVEVKQAYGYGLHEMLSHGRTCDFELDGKINWGSIKTRHFTRTQKGGLEEVNPTPGWRKCEMPRR